MCSQTNAGEPFCPSEEDLIHINVSGMIFVTLKSTLERFPRTLLGDRKRLSGFFVPSKNIIFFDRHRQCFEVILSFYQTHGIMIAPEEISPTLLAEELNFFGLEDVVNDVTSGGEKEDKVFVHPSTRCWQRRLWQIFEDPNSCLASKIFGGFIVSIILLSITVYCIETIPLLHQNTTEPHSESSGFTHVEPWYSIELACVVCFTIEYALRLISCPDKWAFFKSFLNTVDLLTILPYYVIMILNNKMLVAAPVLRLLRLTRICQMFKLYRHSVRFQILGRTLKASQRELSMLFFLLSVAGILFASAIFFAEHEDNPGFTSIPDTFCYILVTMTTVGYGEIVVKTLPGKLICSACAIIGVLALALPLPIMVSHFNRISKRHKKVETKTKQLKTEEVVEGPSTILE